MFLYMFYLGGLAGKSNIEVHDIQFAAVNTPEEAWPLLRSVWYGIPSTLHIDGYSRITWADGYDINLSKMPSDNKSKLFFVNVGGYQSTFLAEIHDFNLFVGQNAEEVKNRAMQVLLKNSAQQHKDNLKDIDDCILLEKIGEYYIHLTPSTLHKSWQSIKPDWQGYQPIAF